MKKRRVASIRNMSKEDKRRLQLNKRLDEKTIEEKRAKFARPTDSKLFVKTNGSEAVRTPLNKRLIAIILAIVMVVGLIPAGIFMLRPKAADNGLGPVEMSVRVNGADNFTTAIVPGGEISKTIEEAEYALSLPDDILFQKAVIIDTSDNTETEIFSAGSLNNKTYYSFDKNSSTGTLMDTETQHMVLVLAEKHPLTLNYDASKGEAVTTASTEGSSTFVWGGESLLVQATPKMDYVLGSVTYTVGNTSRAATVVNNAATIPAREITGQISVSVNFQKISSYKIEEVEEMDNSLFYPDLDKPNNISNHGNIADGPDDSLVPTRDNADSIAPGENASFFLHSQSSSGGSHFELVNLSINGIDIDYPTETNDPKPTTYHDGDYTSIVTVELLNKDTRLSYLGDGSEKHRALYKIDITNIHENLEVNFYFKESTDRNVILKGLKGVKNTGFSEEHDVSLSSNYFYTLNQTKTNVYTAAYINSTNNPSANLAVYTVKPGYNPSSAVYELSRDNGPKSSTGIRNNGRIGNPEAIIDNAGGIFDDSTRYWGKNSGSLSNSEERYGASLFSSGTELMLTTLDRLGDSWYGVALTQHSSNNQQLYINLAPYNYFLRLDLGEGGAMEGYTDRFDKSGNTLTEKSTLGHTVEDRQAYITLPAETPTNSNTQVIFAGWRLIDKNGNPVKSNGNDVIYQNLGQIALSGVNLTAAYGKNTTSAEEADQVISLEAIWEDVNTADVTTIEVNTWAEVPEGTAGAVSKDLTVDGETVTKYYLRVKNHRETQPVDRETIMINMPAPEYEQFYSFNKALSKLSATTIHQTSLDSVPENNVYNLFYDLGYNDFSVTKQVLGNPKQLNNGFEITVKITRPEGAPLTTAEALEGIVFSNGDKGRANVTGDTIEYTKMFSRSETVSFRNVPHGWAITVSEPKAPAPAPGEEPDFETTITSKPEAAGAQVAEGDGYTGPTTWNGVMNQDTSVTVTNKSDSYLVLDKNISRNEDGTYMLTMEAYTTGDVTKDKITEKIPTDFVLVVDQSGSMDTRDMPTGEVTQQNNKYLEDIANGSYYYREPVIDPETEEQMEDEDGNKLFNYYRVYGVKDYLYRYYPANYWFTGDIVEHLGADIGWFMGETDATTNIDNAFYFREVVGDQTYYIPIRTTIEGKIGTYYMRFSYPSKLSGSTYVFNREVTTYSSNGNSPWYKNVLNGNVMTSGALWATANAAVQTLYPNDDAYTYSTINLGLTKPRTGMYINYPMYGRHLSYTKLCYRDVNGVEHEVPSNSNGRTTWEYCDDDGIARTTDSVTSARPTYSGLYTFDGTTDRLSALKAAITEFADTVSKETDTFGAVDNRISIVGFSSSGYSNTEVLTNTERDLPSAKNGWQKSTADNNPDEYYGKALVNATNGTVGNVNPKITQAIDALTANGGTQPEDGLNMAYKIIDGRNEETYTLRGGRDAGQTRDRNVIVVFFTDGQPGDYHESNQYSEANQVVAEAKKIKDYRVDYAKSTSGPNVFSIGVFGESDGNPLTYADTSQQQSNRQSWKYLGGWMETYYSGGTYYCLRRHWRPNNADGYTAIANDTIFDYMSVVSSNYPDAKYYIAPTWLTGGFPGNYIAATDGDAVRQKSTAEATNKYYRMASSQDTLIAAFDSVISLNTEESTVNTIGLGADDSALKDFINANNFVIPSEDDDPLDVHVYTVKGKLSDPQSTKVVWERENPNDETSPEKREEIENPDYAWSVDRTELSVSGFDYGANYIAFNKDPNQTEGTAENEGKKLVVTISGLVPKQDAVGDLESNTEDSGVYRLVSSGESGESKDQLLNKFPIPHLYRHGYTLRETSDSVPSKTNDTFNVTFNRGTGYSGTDGIMVSYTDSERNEPTVLSDSYVWSQATNGNSIYFETFDQNAVLSANIVPDPELDSEKYDYSVSLVDSTATTPQVFGVPFDIQEDSSTIHVHNTTNNRTVVIKESTLGVEGQADYSNKSKKFPIQLKLTKADGETLVSEPISATILRKDNPDDPKSVTLDFHQNEGVVKIELADGDTITFDTLKNYKLTVWEETDDHDGYTDSYRPDNNAAEIGSGVVVIDDDNDNNVVEVINRLNKNPDIESGILDSNNPSKILFAVLGLIAILGAAGAGIFLWKKRNEFVEE